MSSEDSVRLDELRGWLAPGEAGRVLGVSGVWVKELCKRGKLRGVDTALGWLVSPESVEELRAIKEGELAEKLEGMRAGPTRGRQRHAKTLRNSEEELDRITVEATRRARSEIAAERGEESLLPAPSPEEVRARREQRKNGDAS